MNGFELVCNPTHIGIVAHEIARRTQEWGPENIRRLWPFSWYDDQYTWPNVWLGTSVENQAAADNRIPHLLGIPARVRFLSCEPLLGPVDLTCVDDSLGLDPEGYQQLNVLKGFSYDAGYGDYGGRTQQIHWVIVGGESGPHARPMQAQWVRDLRGQCRHAGTPFFFKQTGAVLAKRLGMAGKGDVLEQMPSYLRVREFPQCVTRSTS